MFNFHCSPKLLVEAHEVFIGLDWSNDIAGIKPYIGKAKDKENNFFPHLDTLR